MDRRKKIALATLVIAIGVGLALQFRKPFATPTPSTAGGSGATPSWEISGDSADSSPVKSATSLAGGIEPRTSNPSANASAMANVEPRPSAVVTDRLRNPLRDYNSTPLVPGAAPLNPMRSSTAVQADAGPLEPLVDVNAPEQTHKIVDGDTLTKLAARYLGRAERYLELYEHNRDVLRTPDVLPIGAELRIPSHVVVPRGAESASDALLPVNAGDEGVRATPSSASQLVPVTLGPSTTTGSAATGASTSTLAATKPVAPVAAQRGGPRTYTVQPGDNLVDIARKFYGDGRRHEQLFEANRRTLRTPANLKPGTVLVVP